MNVAQAVGRPPGTYDILDSPYLRRMAGIEALPIGPCGTVQSLDSRAQEAGCGVLQDAVLGGELLRGDLLFQQC